MTKNWYVIEQKYLPGISNTKRHISNILHFSTWNAWKISPYFLVLIFTPSAFAFPLYIRSWYFGVSKNHIWSLQKCIFDKRYVHPNGTSGNFQNIEFFENPNFFFCAWCAPILSMYHEALHMVHTYYKHVTDV